MFQNVVKIGLLAVVLGITAEDAYAFGHARSRYDPGFANYACGGWYSGRSGNGTFQFAEFGGPGGWGAPGCGYTGGAQSNCCSSCGAVGNTYVSSGAQPASDEVMLSVSVPADAKVFVNGRATASSGELRQFTSAGLKQDAAYRYQVRVELVRDGKPVSQEKTVSLAVGSTGSLEFSETPEVQVADKATSVRR
jgi:uncharacterized protein (TIGR03000 family)